MPCEISVWLCYLTTKSLKLIRVYNKKHNPEMFAVYYMSPSGPKHRLFQIEKLRKKKEKKIVMMMMSMTKEKKKNDEEDRRKMEKW
jgi:hypothetical protein